MGKIRTTSCGEIVGTTCQWDGVEAYKGIRYATAGRWEYPALVTSWEGTYEAVSYGACCYQPRAFTDERNSGKAFYYNEFRKDEHYDYSEDCLFLNIWTREKAKPGDKLPVIVYIHGGGYTGGCGHEKHFDGPVWPTLQGGAVAVTINYRLGPLGFLCLPELKEEAGFSGNYGLYDQVAALEWIKKNIDAFGGDPENITVFGQSAGAMSIQQLCMSPITKGLFQKAVMSSGCMATSFMKNGILEKRYEFWQQVMKKVGASNLNEFRNTDVKILFEALDEAKKELKPGMVESPVIDGKLIVMDAVDACKNGLMHDIPYIVGMNAEDIFPPILDGGNKKWSKAMAAKNSKAYRYFFDRDLPGDENGTWHSADLWYWFGTLNNCWRPFEEKDRALSTEFANRLVSFAKTSDPNCSGYTTWKDAGASGKDVLMLGECYASMGHTSTMSLVKTMLTNKSVGE